MPATDGFQVRIQQNSSGEEQFELPLQIFYVVSGNAVLTVRNKKYEMGLEDLILVNGMEPYRLKTGRDGILCTVLINYDLISRMTSATAAAMSLNSLEIPGRPYEDIREIFRELVYFEVLGDDRIRCRKMSLLYELLDILFMHCTSWGSHRSENSTSRMSDVEKLTRILSYINVHFRDSMSLRELAESMYTSTSSLSRFFKKQTGYYFADYLNRVRLAHAVTELTDTGRNITRIAMDCGFSSASVFSKLFHEAYGMTPQEYRKKQADSQAEKENEARKLRQILAGRLEEIRPQITLAVPEADIEVSVTEGQAFDNPWNTVLNMGSLSSLTRANVQYHMQSMVKDLHMSHVKIWSVFSKDLRITDGITMGSYNYSLVDTVLDVIAENNLAVYFDFGSRPDTIIGSKDNVILSEDVGIEFSSREIWEDLFADFIGHLVQRYGREEVGRWIFDFCQDPTFSGNGKYYIDPDYDYFHVFQYAYRTVKFLAPEAKVGGPVGIPNSPGRETESFLKKCVQECCIPDFISVVILPYQPAESGRILARNPDQEYETRQMRQMKQMIRQVAGRNIPLYVCDWNISISNRNILNDSCMRGTYFCSKAGEVMQYASLCSIWVASDWVSNYYDTHTILSGGGGLLTRDSIRKPSYYALQFLGELTGKLLYRSPEMIVTMKNRESFRIVCSNRVSFNIGYYLKEEEELTTDNIDAVVVSHGPVSWSLEIGGLEDGVEYMIKTRSVSRHYGSILDEWLRFGCEEQLFRDDIKYLREICVPHLSLSREKVKNGKLKSTISLDEQEFQLIHIFKRK